MLFFNENRIAPFPDWVIAHPPTLNIISKKRKRRYPPQTKMQRRRGTIITYSAESILLSSLGIFLLAVMFCVNMMWVFRIFYSKMKTRSAMMSQVLSGRSNSFPKALCDLFLTEVEWSDWIWKVRGCLNAWTSFRGYYSLAGFFLVTGLGFAVLDCTRIIKITEALSL